VSLGYLAGTIQKEEQLRFAKIIFRATRGNALTEFGSIKNPIVDFDGRVREKCAYVVVF
jgi:hypothetical protein